MWDLFVSFLVPLTAQAVAPTLGLASAAPRGHGKSLTMGPALLANVLTADLLSSEPRPTLSTLSQIDQA